MSTIGDLLGSNADTLAQSSISIGDVHIIPMDHANGITPKDGKQFRNKFFIVIGFDDKGNMIGGVVFNSEINKHLSPLLAKLHMPISARDYAFLQHDSYINCQGIKVVGKNKFGKSTYRGSITDTSIINEIKARLKSSPTMDRFTLKRFGII